jgi:hypothetical protein
MSSPITAVGGAPLKHQVLPEKMLSTTKKALKLLEEASTESSFRLTKLLT